MVWLNPAALLALLALAGPILVHLLRRQRARTRIVPTVRFIPTTDRSVVRVRTPSDAWLLGLRMAVIACAALALARPLLLTNARAGAWAERMARAVIVDSGDSAAVPPEAVTAQMDSAAFAHRIDASDVPAALRRAAAWLEASPPARREIVILSDFQAGVLGAADVERIPDGIGLRFVPVRTDGPVLVRDLKLPLVLSDAGPLRPQVRIDEITTSATYLRERREADGLRLLVAPQDTAAAATLLRTISRAGVHAPSGSEPIVVRFPGAEALPAAEAKGPRWAVGAARRLRRAADEAGLPLSAYAGAGGLLVDVQAAPDTLAAARAVEASLNARPDPRTLAEQEIARIPTEALNAWGREAPPADLDAWPRSDESDGRWLWLLALLLLGLETVVRRSPILPARDVERHAA